MKKTKITRFLLVLFLTLSLPVFGQTNVNEIKTAINVLKGKDDSMDKSEALKLLEESQIEENDGYILNVLGIAYLHGIGVVPDTVKSIAFFENAGSAGYYPAYHNLGMYYKYARPGVQDFYKAFDSFRKGASEKCVSNYYNCGFMKYKGLGCKQNYQEAIEYFKQAANYNNADAIFMLGLCYRNGYGVDTDSTIANIYLKQSANLGCISAMEELMKEEPENSWCNRVVEIESDVEVPEVMPSLDPYIPANKQEIAGNYHGYSATYDWSGTKIVSEKKVSLVLNVIDTLVTGFWINDTDSIAINAKISDSGSLIFDNIENTMYDRYSCNNHSRYRFDHLEINYFNGIIAGKLRLYSMDEQEPERPMYVSLEKDIFDQGKQSNDQNAALPKLIAFSSPSSNQIILKFFLEQEANDVMVRITNNVGSNCQIFKCGHLESGEQIISLSPILESGYYSINVTAGTCNLKTMIVK